MIVRYPHQKRRNAPKTIFDGSRRIAVADDLVSLQRRWPHAARIFPGLGFGSGCIDLLRQWGWQAYPKVQVHLPPGERSLADRTISAGRRGARSWLLSEQNNQREMML